jgi:hypothetical protein
MVGIGVTPLPDVGTSAAQPADSTANSVASAAIAIFTIGIRLLGLLAFIEAPFVYW